jgi:hypothetical protein
MTKFGPGCEETEPLRNADDYARAVSRGRFAQEWSLDQRIRWTCDAQLTESPFWETWGKWGLA